MHTQIEVFFYMMKIITFLDGYCSTVQGLLDWFEVDLGFTEISFIQIEAFFYMMIIITMTQELGERDGTHSLYADTHSACCTHHTFCVSGHTT